MGYHLSRIKKGVVGEVSKIQEEVDELKDALEQCNPIMALCELSDIILACDCLLEKKFPGFSFADLSIMAAATKRAFQDGSRT